MADLLELNPELLLSQSQEMVRLHNSFETLFGSISSDLKGINGSWSDMMSNNFTGKIGSAQKSFLGSLGMLQNCSNSTRMVANSILELDSGWASKLAGGSFASLSSAGINEVLGKALKGIGTGISGYTAASDEVNEKYKEIKEEILKKIFPHSSGRAWAEKLAKDNLENILGGNKDMVSAFNKLITGDYEGAIESVGKDAILPLAQYIVKVEEGSIPDDDLKKYIKYGINVTKDTATAVTEFVLKPNAENLTNIFWSATGKPVLDTANKDIEKVVKLIPGISEYYYDQNGAEKIGDVYRIALRDLYTTFTGDSEAGQYAYDYYAEGSAFSNVWNGIKDIKDYFVDGGPDAFKAFVKTAGKDLSATAQNTGENLKIIAQHGGFVSSIAEGFVDIVQEQFQLGDYKK